MVKKMMRYGLKAIAWIMGIVIFLWIALWIYVELNEARVIGRISAGIHEKTRGTVSIGGVSVSLIRTFPVLSLQLSGVVLRDSLYALHKKDFLTASDIYLRFSLRELIRGRSALGRITVYNGQVNIMGDSLGRTNEYILRQETRPEGQPKSSVPVIILNHTGIHYEDLRRRKRYDALFHRLRCEVGTTDQFVTCNVALNARMNDLAFNTRKGSYLKNSDLSGNFRLVYNKTDHRLLVDQVGLNINRHPFRFDGYFRIDKTASDFSLAIATENIAFRDAAALLPDSLAARLDDYEFSKPITVQATVFGQTASGHVPDVRIRMHVDMASVVKAAGITSMQFNRGTGDVDITIVSSVQDKEFANGRLNGIIVLKDVGMTYLPKKFELKHCSGNIKFNGNDILIDSLSALAGQTSLFMDGQTRNLFSLGGNDPGKLTMHWKLFSPDLHINDFRAFLAQRRVNARPSNQDKLFSNSDIFINLSAKKMDYKHFRATGVSGMLVLKKSGIQLRQAFLHHANGSMEMTGELRNSGKNNPITLHTRMKNMDVPLLFAAFDNFGQDAITKDNLKGRLSADIRFSASLTDQAELVGADSKGTVGFLLENGELNNFEPLMEASKKAFKKQDLSKIRFASLRNTLEISGTTFIINPMEIRSTAATLFVEGVYDYKKGTDMSIRFPLRNLTRNQANTDLSSEAKTRKGLSVLLRAKTGDDGKLKLSWDPFRKSIKNRDVIRDSLETAQ